MMFLPILLDIILLLSLIGVIIVSLQTVRQLASDAADRTTIPQTTREAKLEETTELHTEDDLIDKKDGMAPEYSDLLIYFSKLLDFETLDKNLPLTLLLNNSAQKYSDLLIYFSKLLDFETLDKNLPLTLLLNNSSVSDIQIKHSQTPLTQSDLISPLGNSKLNA